MKDESELSHHYKRENFQHSFIFCPYVIGLLLPEIMRKNVSQIISA